MMRGLEEKLLLFPHHFGPNDLIILIQDMRCYIPKKQHDNPLSLCKRRSVYSENKHNAAYICNSTNKLINVPHFAKASRGFQPVKLTNVENSF